MVAQVTKTGFVFVLDRATGEPFLPIEERPVNQAGAPGEALSPTQPYPAVTPPVVPSQLSPDDAFGITWFDRRACRQRIAGARAEGLFTPPSEQGTILYPFTGGGANWGSAAFDPTRNLLVINMSSVAHHVQLIPADQVAAMRQAFPDAEVSTQAGAPFGMKRELLLSPFGIPCTQPPWGVLAGVDLALGEIVWRKTLGEIAIRQNFPKPPSQTASLSGPLMFIGLGSGSNGAAVKAQRRDKSQLEVNPRASLLDAFGSLSVLSAAAGCPEQRQRPRAPLGAHVQARVPAPSSAATEDAPTAMRE